MAWLVQMAAFVTLLHSINVMGAPALKEYVVISSGTCEVLNGCTSAVSQEECSTFATHVAEAKNASSVLKAINPAPKGCYLFKNSGKLYFNDGHEKETKCSTDRRCLCECEPAVDVAFYDDKGASSRGKVNIWEVLNYRSDIRAHNFSADEIRRFLHVANYDVVFFPGGGGGTEQKTIGATGLQAVKDFLASGGGYVGVCAGAYLALDALKIAPYKNLHKYYGDRGDGNCSLTLTPNSGLTVHGVQNSSLTAKPIFYGGGPVMEPSTKAHPNVSDPREHVLFTAPVPWRAEKKPPYPTNASDYQMGVGLAAVVSATYAGKGTVVVVGPHPETDEMDFPHRHGPPAVKGGVRATLLQSFVRYAAVPQPPLSNPPVKDAVPQPPLSNPPDKDAVSPSTTLSPCSGGAACPCMPRSEFIKRAATWLGKVPYDHGKSHCPGECKGKYPTDCSGLVSWAANVTHADGTPHVVKAHTWGSVNFSSPVSKDEIMQADIITHVPASCGGHVYIFDKWDDPKTKTHFWAYESTETYNVEPCCKNRTCPCLNHYVNKSWASQPGQWAQSDTCIDGKDSGKQICTKENPCHGGPRRINPAYVCAPAIDNDVLLVV